MSDNHFIPQYHFRLFTGQKRYIHLARRDGSCFAHGRQFVRNAPIKDQCAPRNFYGNERIEKWLGTLETRHSPVYRAVIDIAWGTRTSALSDEEDNHLREAILLQRVRTPSRAAVTASLFNRTVLYIYCDYLKTLPTTPERQTIIDAIQRGKATLKNSQFVALMNLLQHIESRVVTISDLSLLILRNQTAVPFIIGDVPCVFSNRYMRNIQDSGVLGCTTPGLMAALPINWRTQILCYDAGVYQPDYSTAGCIDIFHIADVSLLNALQVHSAKENIYFSDESSEDYLSKLLSAHRPLLQNHTGEFVSHNPGEVLINGVPSTGEVLHTFEPQLPITLDLSFISTSPLPSGINPNLPRDRVLYEQVIPNETSSIGINELVTGLEHEICISGDV